MNKYLPFFGLSLLVGILYAYGPAGSYIENKSTYQLNARFNVSSGTIKNLLTVKDIAIGSNTVPLSYIQYDDDGDLWITANAYFENGNWYRRNEGKHAFGLEFIGNGLFPDEVDQGWAVWRASPGANPISSVFGSVGGWELGMDITSNRDMVIGGGSLEMDGFGTYPYGRLIHSSLAGDGLHRTGVGVNIYNDNTSRDSPAYPSWFFGVTADQYMVTRAIEGAATELYPLIIISTDNPNVITTPNYISVYQIKFPDGSIQTTASVGSGGGDNLGNHIATKTITAGYGINATTATYSGNISGSGGITISAGLSQLSTTTMIAPLYMGTNRISFTDYPIAAPYIKRDDALNELIFSNGVGPTINKYRFYGGSHDEARIVFDDEGYIGYDSGPSTFAVNQPIYFESTMTLSGYRPVRNISPTNGQVLAWNNSTSVWEPTTPTSGSGSSSLEVLDEGVQKSSPTSTINFVGAGVTATFVSPSSITVTIPGGSGKEIYPATDTIRSVYGISASSMVLSSNANPIAQFQSPYQSLYVSNMGEIGPVDFGVYTGDEDSNEGLYIYASSSSYSDANKTTKYPYIRLKGISSDAPASYGGWLQMGIFGGDADSPALTIRNPNYVGGIPNPGVIVEHTTFTIYNSASRNSTMNPTLSFYRYNGFDNFLNIKSSFTNATGGSVNLTLPGTVGTSAQVLATDGSGNMYWKTDATGSGGDNLGTHIATKTITAGYGINATTGVFSTSESQILQISGPDVNTYFTDRGFSTGREFASYNVGDTNANETFTIMAASTSYGATATRYPYIEMFPVDPSAPPNTGGRINIGIISGHADSPSLILNNPYNALGEYWAGFTVSHSTLTIGNMVGRAVSFNSGLNPYGNGPYLNIVSSFPAGMSNDVNLTLPGSVGSASQVLATDGTGRMYWKADATGSGSGGDNLGTHIATKTITANFGISGTTISLSGSYSEPYAMDIRSLNNTLTDVHIGGDGDGRLILANGNDDPFIWAAYSSSSTYDSYHPLYYLDDVHFNEEVFVSTITAMYGEITKTDGLTHGDTVYFGFDSKPTGYGNNFFIKYNKETNRLPSSFIIQATTGTKETSLKFEPYHPYISMTPKDTTQAGVLSMGIFEPGVSYGMEFYENEIDFYDNANFYSNLGVDAFHQATFASTMTLSGSRVVKDIAPSDGQALVWDNANSLWKPGTVTGGSGSSIYPATATASFPYGISASTVVISTSISSGQTAYDTGTGFWMGKKFDTLEGTVYSTRKKLTVDGSKVTNTLYNYPVSVTLSTNNFTFSNTTSDGDDIKFALTDGTTLAFEREIHVGTTAQYWVKIPTITASTNLDFYIYYKNDESIVDAENSTSTWAGNGFRGVYHMTQQNGNYLDSSGYANHVSTWRITQGVAVGGSRGFTGGYDFNGTNQSLGHYVKLAASATDYFQICDSASLNMGTTDYTIMLRAKGHTVLDNTSEFHDGDMMRKGSTGITSNSWWKIEWGDDVATDRINLLQRVAGGDDAVTYDFTRDNSWHTFMGARRTADTSLRLYIDGTERGTADLDAGGNVNNDSSLGLGNKDTLTACNVAGTDDAFAGAIDEVWISSGYLPIGFVATTHNNLNGSLLTYGSEETGTYVFSIGNPSGNSVTWDGSALNVDGSLTVNGSAVLVAGSSKTINVAISSGSTWNSITIPIWIAPQNTAVTIRSIRAAVYGGTSLTFNVEERAWASLGSAGTDVMTSDIVADTDGAVSTTFSNSSIAAGAHLVFTTAGSAASGAVEAVTLQINYTEDTQ